MRGCLFSVGKPAVSATDRNPKELCAIEPAAFCDVKRYSERRTDRALQHMASETYFKNHAHTAGIDLCRSWRPASLPLLGLVSYDSAKAGNWTERLPVRFKWSAAG
jgi:hypothetical protein